MAYTFRKGTSTGITTTVATDTTITIPAGAAVIVGVTAQERGFSGGTVSVADNGSGGTLTYSSIGSIVSGADGQSAELFKAVNSGSDSTTATFTATFSVSQRYKVIMVWVCDDLDTGAGFPFDHGGATAAASTVVTVSALDTTGDARIIAISCSNNDRSWTPDTGYTEDFDCNISIGSSSGQGQNKTQTGAGSYSVAATASSSSNLSMYAAAFKITAGAATATTAWITA